MSSLPDQQTRINEDTCQRWLKFQAKVLQSTVRGSIYFKRGPNSVTESQSRYILWPSDFESTSHFHQVCSRAEQEQKGVILRFQDQSNLKNDTPRNIHIALPLLHDKEILLIAAFELLPRDTQQLHTSMQQLEVGIQWLQDQLAYAREDKSSDTVSSQVSDVLLRINEKQSLIEASSALADELATLLNCTRVSIGRNYRDQITVIAISQQPTFEKTSPLVISITQAAQECFDQDTRIIFPENSEKPGPISHQHQKLGKTHGSKQIISIPIACTTDDEKFVLILENEEEKNLHVDELEILGRLSTCIGPILNNISLQEQSLLRLNVQRLKKTFQNFSHNKTSTLLKTVIPLFLLLILLFGTSGFRIDADVTLTGTVLRSIVAPFPGYIDEATKSAGDHVVAGESLAQLDISDIILDELSWKSKYTQADLEYRKAIADNATSQAKIISQQKKQAEIQLSLLQAKKKRATIIAPFDGVIVTGDLSQTIGGPVDKGKLLFKMVPDGGYRIYAQVDEADISFIEVGQSGALVFNSLPKDTFDFTVTKITPIATAQDGTNSFRVEGDLQPTTKRLNPGMTGYGKITVGTKPYIWLWTRTLVNKIHLLSWNLMP